MKLKIRKAKDGCYFTKEGMTSIIKEDGSIIPVTVLKKINNTILGKKENNNTLCVFDGYYGRFNKPEIGTLKKYTEDPYKKGFIKEISFTDDLSESVSLEFFEKMDFVDVSAKTKGHGFQGAMKRHGFKGGRASHGNSLAHRSLGSTGCRHLPARTIKGRKMAGHMGNQLRTQQNLKVVRIDLEENALFVLGSVPGPRRTIVFVQQAIKKGGK